MIELYRKRFYLCLLSFTYCSIIMLIDIVTAILLIAAVFKGISRGLIVAVFSYLAIMAGVAAAMRFSVTVAEWLQHSFNAAREWLPILSFIIVVAAVVLLVRLAAKFIETAVDAAMLGSFNKIGGALLYILLYLGVYSIVLFYLTKMQLIKSETISESVTYSYIEPLGTHAVNLLGDAIPFFKNMFDKLTAFFNTIPNS